LDDLEGALADYEQALSRDPALASSLAAERAYVYSLRAFVRVQSANLDGAIADYDEAARLSPASAGEFATERAAALAARAAARTKEGLLDGGVSDYEAALALTPDDGSLKASLAAVFGMRAASRLKRSDFAGALVDLDASSRLAPLSAPDSVLRGDALLGLGNRDEAGDEYARAAQVDPSLDLEARRAILSGTLDLPESVGQHGLAYIYSPDGRYGQLRVIVRGHPDKTLLRGEAFEGGAVFGPVWSPDGSVIALHCGGRTCVVDPQTELVRTAECSIERVAWAPDGTRFAALCGRTIGVQGVSDLAIISIADMSVSIVTKAELDNQISGLNRAAWSAEGTEVAFTRYNNRGQWDAYIVNVATGEERLLRANTRPDGPAWSPDGTLIAVNRMSTVELFRPDGTAMGFPTVGSNAVWSPDGQYFSVNGLGVDAGDLKLVHLSGRTVSIPDRSSFHVAWSPDGSRIAALTSQQVRSGDVVTLYTEIHVYDTATGREVGEAIPGGSEPSWVAIRRGPL
jgi:hypothetical protein